MPLQIRIKRVYEPFDPLDGFRVLVDRLWPRGLTKEQVHADLWMKEIAPGTCLRTWYHRNLSQWDEFKRRYFLELDTRTQDLVALLDAAGQKPLTLLFAVRDTEHNHAILLKEYLLAKFAR